MNAAAYLVALRRRASKVSDARDPLAEARRFLAAHGHTAEGMAFRKVISTLATGNGAFRESEVWLFSQEALGLIAALIDARTGGGYPYTTEDFRAALE
jgi:hypothetical protein